MSSIGSQPRPLLAEIARRDYARITTGKRILASYRIQNGSNGADVLITLSPLEGGERKPGLPAVADGGGGFAVSRYMLSVIGPAAGETAGVSGVTASGGVLQLRRGDAFIVPGWAAGEPGSSTVTVVVRTLPRLIEASHWVAEVTRG